jgi:hypothetical protein
VVSSRDQSVFANAPEPEGSVIPNHAAPDGQPTDGVGFRKPPPKRAANSLW